MMNRILMKFDRRKIFVAMVLVLLLSLAVVIVVAAQQGDGFDLSWNVIGGGGGPMSADGYSLNGTLGQTAVGSTSASDHTAQQGFWQEFLSIVYNRLPFMVKH